MKNSARIGAVVALFGAQIALVPLGAGAQVPDPCKPVPVPGLCNDDGPLPSPPGTSPSPKPGGGGGGGGGGGNDNGGNGGGKAPKPNKTKPGKYAVSGPNSTARLIELLTPLVRKGANLQELLSEVAGPFPVAGPAWWTNDWHAPRSGGRVHKGLDIFAPHGTPLVAAASGVLSQKGAGGLCGIYVEITDARGVEYFYCHMSAHAAGLRVGQSVEVGQLVGYVGNTGNAISTPSHVHFEFQPGGTPAPPKPHVDRWVRLAERKVLGLLKAEGIELPAAAQEELQFRLTRLFDLAGTGGQVPESSDSLLLLTGLQPAASGLELAHRTLGQMAWEIDWSGHVNGQLAALVADYREYVIGSEMMGLSPWPFEEEPDAPTTMDGSD